MSRWLRVSIALAALGFLAAVPVRAHDRSGTFATFTIEDGLPQSQVRVIHSGQWGSLWVGTLGGGLSRFDGRSFLTFTTEGGLPDDSITALAQDGDGRLWIGTERGLAVLRRRKVETVVNLSAITRALLVTRRGDILAGGDYGLVTYDRQTLTRRGELADLRPVTVSVLLEDRGGTVWVGTWQRGLARLARGQLTFVPGLDGRAVRALLQTADGRVWVGTNAGVFVHDGSRLTPLASAELRDAGVHALLEGANGEVWIATEAAGVCRSGRGATTCYTEEDGLPSNTAWALARDFEGGIWVGTYRGGLSRFLGAGKLDPALRRALHDTVTRSVLQDRRGRYWFATDDRGVLQVDGARRRWFRRRDGLAHDFVLTIFEDRRGTLWFGTLSGVSRYDGTTFRTFGAADGLAGGVVRAFAEDAQGAIWVATNARGVFRWDGQRLRQFTTADGLNATAVYSLLVDSAGRLWAGTARGLSLFEGERFINASRRLGVPEVNVNAIAEQPGTGDLWLALFGTGLARLPQPQLAGNSGEAHGPKVLRAPDALVSDRVVSLAFDRTGQLWAGTEAGVERIRLTGGRSAADPEVNHFGAVEGPGRLECIHGAALVDRRGHVWFGTLGGPVRYDPQQGPVPSGGVRVWLHGVGPAPDDWRWTSWLSARTRDPRSQLRLAYDENHVAFRVEGVSPSQPSRVRFQFRLDGHDADWSPVTTSKVANYSRLPAGTFTFRVRATTDGQRWVDASTPFSFRVLAPFWQQGWFQALGMFVLALALYAGHRRSLSSLRTHELELRAEIDERHRAEEALRRTNRALRLLGECSQALVRATAESALVDDVCGLVVRIGGYRCCWVGLADRGPARRVVPVAAAGLDRETLDAFGFGWGEDEAGRGPTGQAIRTGRPAIVRDVREELDGGTWRELATRAGCGSIAALPLTRDGHVLGVLTIAAEDPEAFHEQEVQLLDELASDLAYGIGALRMAADQQRLRSRMQHLQKLESLELLAGGVAHDFNNLLVGILGNAGLALMDLDPASPVRPLLEGVRSSAQQAADLANQMLAYSGRGRFVIERVDLSALVREMAQLLESLVARQATLRFDCAAELPAVEGDATQLRQVVLNLVTNAREALGPDGRIELATGVMLVDDGHSATTEGTHPVAPGRYVYLEVSDTGCGMDGPTRAKIFDPFFTTKFTGRGLGLAVALGIVGAHRGTLLVDTEVGRGTRVRVLLPAAAEGFAVVGGRAVPKAREDTGTWRGEGTILVVDDDQGVRRLAERLLRRFGFEVTVAADGEEAVRLFREEQVNIRAVLLDLTMPGLSGEETFRQLHALRPDVPVVLSSGFTSSEVADRFRGVRPAAFVQKPYEPKTLIETLRSVLEVDARREVGESLDRSA